MLVDQLTTSFATKLLRKAATTPSRWGENYVVMGKPVPGPMRISPNFPWSRELMDCNDDWVGKKGAQMAFTLACLMRGLQTIDIKQVDVMYILPKQKPDAMDFSKSKLDPILNNSQYLKNLFSGGVDNAGHKQAGNVNFYLRGSRSRSALKSISVGLQIYDEYDEMAQVNLSLAEERSAGYEEKDIQTIKISTPTFPDYGISKEYENSDQSHYFFKCPFCSQNGKPKWTEFLDLESLIIPTDDRNDRNKLKESYLITSCCKHRLPDFKPAYINEQNARWFATKSSNAVRGFWIPQLYSIVRPLYRIARKVLDGKSDQVINKEVHNSILAKEYVAEGARVQPEQVDACKGTHSNRSTPQSRVVTMGVDVGHKTLYCHIDEWLIPENPGINLNTRAICITRSIVTVQNFHELDPLMHQNQILHAIIDVDPAQREAIDFCNRFQGHANLCRFVRNISGRSVNSEQSNDLVMQVNRTCWLDVSQGRYRMGTKAICLPYDIPRDYSMMISRIIKEDYYDKEKNLVSTYKSIGADHWAFARLYSEIALPKAISVYQSKNIENFL